MTSAIVSSTIDAAFPVAGQDNNSQGFRDNFQVTKTGLAQAATEISALQLNTAKLDTTNDFAGSIIQNAVTNKLYGVVATILSVGDPTPGATVNVQVSTGEYHRITIAANATLELTNWPILVNRFAKVRIHLENNELSPHTITFATNALATVSDDDSGKFTTHAIIVPAGKTVIVEAWKYDYGSGSKMYIRYIGEFA
jgi:hypothetical protein